MFIQIQIVLLHYNVLHGQPRSDPSYGKPPQSLPLDKLQSQSDAILQYKIWL